MLAHRIVLALLTAGLVAPAGASAAGSLEGNVTNAAATPLQGICVAVYSASSSVFPVDTTATDPAGDYVVGGLTPGEYKLYLHDDLGTCPTGTDSFVGQWWQDRSGFDTADLLVITDAHTTTADAVMKQPAGIAGPLQGANGAALEHICVSAVPASAIDPYGPPGGFAQTNASGDYLMEAPADQYKVQFYDGGFPCNVGKYANQWYHDKPDPASADIVVVASGITTSGIDAVMYAPTRITGHVQDEGGAALDGICVVANLAATPNGPGLPPGFARTNPAGDYVMGIAPGDYKISFYDNGIPCSVGKYVSQWFNGKSDFASADVIHVVRGATVTGIGAPLKLFQPVTTSTPPPPPPVATRCRVPRLHGVKLKQAKRRLHAAHCRV